MAADLYGGGKDHSTFFDEAQPLGCNSPLQSPQDFEIRYTAAGYDTKLVSGSLV
jgi:hypothetical protein